MKRETAWITIVCLFFLVSSCTTLKTAKNEIVQKIKETGEEAEAPGSKTEATPGKGEPYYVGVDGLKLYGEPRFSKTHLTRLPLNQKVVRYKQERGFAYVQVVGTDRKGWVENSRLSPRPVAEKKEKPSSPADEPKAKPSAETEKPPETEKAASEEATGPDETRDSQATATDSLKPGEAQAAPIPTEEKAEAKEQPQTEKEPKKKPDASIFDAF